MLRWIRQLVGWRTRVVQRRHALEDAAALARGWTAEATDGGRGRHYHDPRFDERLLIAALRSETNDTDEAHAE